MRDQKRTLLKTYLIGAGIIATVWFFLTFIVTLALAGTEDNPDMAAKVPFFLKVAYRVMLFPMQEFLSWNWMLNHFGERKAVKLEIVAMSFNSLLWGFLLIFLYGLTKRIIRIMKGQTKTLDISD